jgi:hypothetical protein
VEIEAKGLRVNLDGAQWRRSNRSATGSESSATGSENCVEVAFVGGAIVVREAGNPAGPVLLFTPDEWDAFVAGAKDGEFDL